MHTPKSDDWRTATSDQDLLQVVLAFIEEQIDEESELTKIRSVESLPSEQRALATMSRVWAEVENGGLPQFFYNKPDVQWHTWAIEAARLLGMPSTGKALEIGGGIIRELLPGLERGQLDWSEYYDLVGEAFKARCGSTFWPDELDEFERRGAAYIRSNPDLSSLAPKLLEKHAEEEFARRDKERVVSNRERGLLFTADRLVAYLDDFTPDEAHELCLAKQSWDGTIHVDYKYSDDAWGLLVICEVDLHPSENDAEYWCEASSRMLWSALGWNLNPKQQVEERNEFFRWGDQSYYSVIMREGEPAGFGFHARSGLKRFSLTLQGLLFQDTEAIAKALGPALENLLAYEP